MEMTSPQSPAPTYHHSVTLIGKDRTQQAILVIDDSSITIHDRSSKQQPEENALIARILFRFVYKLCKASARSRNAGTPRMLDICIHSKKGLRELRVELSSIGQVCFSGLVAESMVSPARSACEGNNGSGGRHQERQVANTGAYPRDVKQTHKWF
jgi:hypothetical protein